MSILDTIKSGFDSLTGAVKSGASTLLSSPSALGQYMGNYRYPSDLTTGAGRNFYIDIQFRQYQRRSIFNQPFLKANGGIQLPIPNNLQEALAVDWRPEGGNAAVGAGIEYLLGQTNNLEQFQSGNTSLSELGTLAAKTGALAVGAGATSNVLDKINSTIPGAATQSLQLVGRAQNPFLTMLFKQPTFREYNFSWRLAPRNAQESETIKQIILAFKANMLPAMSPGAAGVLLTYPNMAMVSFYPAEDFLFKFKPCVVADFRVNYSDGGMPSFFKGTNAPTLINISIRLQEIEYWLREDIVNPSMRSEGSLVGTSVNTGYPNQNLNQPLPKASSNGRVVGGL